MLLILLNLHRYPFDSAHHEIADSLIDDEDDELTSDLPEFISSISLGGENSIADDNQNLAHLNHTSSYSDNSSSSLFVQTKDYLDIELSEDNSQIVNPRNNEEIYKFLLRVYALLRQVRIFISMAREVAALQRHIHNKLGDNKGGFILDVKTQIMTAPIEMLFFTFFTYGDGAFQVQHGSHDSTYPLPDPVLDRFCLQILPKIHCNIKWLNLESSSMTRILLATNYPILYGLGLYNIDVETALSLFTVTNNFPGGLFKCVREITLEDEHPFEHEFFLRIAQSFPFIKVLSIRNSEPQNNKLCKESMNDNEIFSIIKYPDLTNITFYYAHDDYIEEFLIHTKICLPDNAVHLNIHLEQLKRVTYNFTRDATRINCVKLRYLCLNGRRLPEYAKDYFPNV
ncbi:unnamed protein product [Rotaria sordida]|uniref:Uncharacterized protein n=1 Tax=Rotaria sordida TaxID=392033 RepID=A0A818XJY1_9BILA|nr:unnamed protein product [Rotaria sordida]